MTPKDKARQLINRFIEDGLHEKYMGVKSARQCALITVDEIIKSKPYWEPQEEFEYWEEIKQELEKS